MKLGTTLAMINGIVCQEMIQIPDMFLYVSSKSFSTKSWLHLKNCNIDGMFSGSIDVNIS